SSNIALMISDIDGTIITSNHEVTEATRQAAARLYERGIQLSLASSRPARSIRPIAEALNLRSPFAAFNGALVARADGEIVARSIIPPEVTARVKAIADDLGIDVWLYDENEWYASNRNAFVDREEHTSGFSPNMELYDEKIARELNKLTVVGKPELVAEVEQRVLAELASEVSASRSKPRFLDVTSYGIHKGTVVVRLAELLGISTDGVAVIGDGPNDVEMFRQAAVSIAMGQAVDEVKSVASCVTSSNDDEGWARGVEKYVLGGYQSAGI
ncbi:MAG TPA: HAD family hydrolase, partial [Blastocatellia bacterium]|nr:HAD family hydrolase [Blastocatellia bacterium]